MPETGGTYYDRQEVRNPAEREASMFHALPGLIRHALDNAPFFAELLAGNRPGRRRQPRRPRPSACAAQVGAERTADSGTARSAASPPRRCHVWPASSPRPGRSTIPRARGTDYWRFARAMYAAGFRTGDIVHNSFSYHLTPAGAMAESGARALGLPVIPGGTGQTELQLRAIADIGATAYAGTPSFLLALLEKGRELGHRYLVPDGRRWSRREAIPAGDTRAAGSRSSASAPCSATPAPISD